MSLARTAARGAAWSMGLAMAARAVGLLGTLVITRYLAPETMGEVQVAMVLVTTAHYFSLMGLGHYVVAKPNEGREAAFHSTLMSLVLGALAIGGVVLFGSKLALSFDAPAATKYLPGVAVAVAFDRLCFIPSRILVRDMRFRAAGLVRTVGELIFPVVAVGLAVRGHGGEALVYANIARSGARAAATIGAVGLRDWLAPCHLSMQRTRAILSFGLPNGVAGMTGFAARYWDNLLMARLFGPAELGYYQLAYNLSDLPSNQLGEHVGDVLLPSFARLPAERCAAALARAVRLLGLLMFPLALGLAVMSPTIVAAFLNPAWEPVGARATILAALSAFYPIGFAVHSYLNASGHPRWVMILSVFRTAVLLGGMLVLGWMGGPLWACAGVGLAFGAYTFASLILAARLAAISPWALVAGLVRPFIACVPMVMAVLGTRVLLRSGGVTASAVFVAGELVAGAVVYVTSALLIARAASRDLLQVVGGVLARKRAVAVVALGQTPAPTKARNAGD